MDQLPLEELRKYLDPAYRSLLKAFTPVDLFENDDDQEDAGQEVGNPVSPGDGATSGE